MSESEYDPLQKNRRLWNDSESIMSDSMAGIVMMHRNLVYLDNCKAVLRRDYNKMHERVRIVGGGSLLDGPMYAGFVGPGMLTAAVLGLPENSTPGIPSADSIFDVIQRVAKDEEEKMNEVLVLVQDCTEYFLNFMEAKKKAEEAKIPLKLLFVRDEVNFKLSQKPSSPRSPSGLLLLYKIAGAMSEEGKTLNEIYHKCDEIMKDGIIGSIGLYIEEFDKESSQIQICRGDRLSDRDSKKFPVAGSTTKKIVETLMTDLINGNEYHKFPKESQLVVMLDYFGGFTELEASIVMKEFLQLSNRYKYKVELILTGSFHTSMEVNGFHFSIFNVSYDQEFLYYLKMPTVAFSWPKTSIREIHSPSDIKNKRKNSMDKSIYHQNGNQIQIVAVESNSFQNSDPIKMSPQTISTDQPSHYHNGNQFEIVAVDTNSYQNNDPIKLSPGEKSNNQNKDKIEVSEEEKEGLNEVEILQAEILLKAVEYACQALIACTHRIDSLDRETPQNFEKCGTRLCRIASIIKSSINEKQFDGSNACNVIYQIAMICQQNLPDPQAELYTLFFNAIGQALEDEDCLQTKHWLDAFIAANNLMDEVTGGSKIADTLYAATSTFCETYSESVGNVIDSLGLAVSAAQNLTLNVNVETISDKNFKENGFCGFAGAHALGIWLRGAYEGLKLKYSRPKVRHKRTRETSDDDDEVEDVERASKIKKVSHNDSVDDEDNEGNEDVEDNEDGDGSDIVEECVDDEEEDDDDDDDDEVEVDERDKSIEDDESEGGDNDNDNGNENDEDQDDEGEDSDVDIYQDL